MSGITPPSSGKHVTNDTSTAPLAQDYQISITLTDTHPPHFCRRILLSPGHPTPIGRASKSETKNLQASRTNALFDSPVVSRHHAELQAHPWAATVDQVSIVDKGSMHGTRVNGTVLERGRPMSLRSGDVLQFGEKVTRGSDTHEGVLVNFGCKPPHSQSSHTLAEIIPDSRNRRSFHCPSSDEESDVASVQDVSVNSDEEEVEEEPQSSTISNESPEQFTSKLGSQEEPIIVESDVAAVTQHPAVISLEDDEEEYVPPSPLFPKSLGQQVKHSQHVEHPHHVEVIQDSIDQGAEIIAPASFRWFAPNSAMTDLHESVPSSDDDDDDDESVFKHNTGLTAILNDGHHIQGVEATQDEADVESSDDENSEEVDYPNGSDGEEENGDEEDENNSEDASPSADTDSENSEPLEDGFSDIIESAFTKHSQPSPELGSDDPAPSHGSMHNLHPLSSAAPQKPRYDPVRGSQPPLKPSFTPETYAGPFKTPSTYTYAPSAFSRVGIPVNTDLRNDFYGNSGRWDIPPAPSPYSSFKRPINNYAEGGSLFDNVYPSSAQAGPPAINLQSMDERPRMDPLQPFSFSHSWTDVPHAAGFLDLSTVPVKSSYEPSADPTLLKSPAPINKNSNTTNKKISITDIVEDKDMDASAGTGQDVIGNVGHIKSSGTLEVDDTFGFPKPTEKTKSGTKRKADEIASETPAILPTTGADSEWAKIWREIDSPRLPVPQEPTHEPQGPPTRRRRMNASAPQAAGAAGEVVKFAAAAALGGVGTMVFLCSPLAERMLQWLA